MHWSESPADSPAYNICFGTYSSYIEGWLKLNSLQDLLYQQPFKMDPPIGAIAGDGDVELFPGQSNLDRAGFEAVTLALLAELKLGEVTGPDGKKTQNTLQKPFCTFR